MQSLQQDTHRDDVRGVGSLNPEDESNGPSGEIEALSDATLKSGILDVDRLTKACILSGSW